MDKFILILGGNGFIGAECVEHLLETYGDEYKLVLVNRGNWNDWDASTRIRPKIHENIIFDRSEGNCAEFRASLETKYPKFEAVIDFSGFKAKQVEKVIKSIAPERIAKYIYISTDSVYEVCLPVEPKRDRGLLEIDSVRPNQENEIKRLKKLDSYAHHKFKCEEVLWKLSKDKFPVVMLRLPDVIGERDSSNRFWQLQMQLEYLEYKQPDATHTIEISRPFFELKTSYVDVKDIARVVTQLVKSNIQNEIFNIGCETPLTLAEFYKILAAVIKPGLERRLRFVSSDKEMFHPFPSVTKGPVCIEKIQQTMSFKPSRVEDVLKRCVHFYQQAFTNQPKMRRQVEKEVKKDLNIHSEQEKQHFQTFLNTYRV